MESEYLVLENCLACDSSNLKMILDLQKQPLANEYIETYIDRKKYELKLNVCTRCFHVQLTVAVNPDLIFTNYPYVTSTSQTMQEYFRNLAKVIANENTTGHKILDIGSNDGTFLSNFAATGWTVLGVDPAINLVKNAAHKKVLNLPSMFDLKTTELLAKDFDVVTAFNVFAHNSDPLEMLTSVKKITHENSSIYILTSQSEMIHKSQFDTAYHEHISFFNVKSMKKLLSRAGLFLESVEIVDIHGSSYLWKIVRNRTSHALTEREEIEQRVGLYDMGIYENYKLKTEVHRNQVKQIIRQFIAKGFTFCCYGSAAKGNTFLNSIEVIPDHIFDDTPEKIGKYSPVGDRLVENPNNIGELQGKLLIVLPAWNFASEIIGRISAIPRQATETIIMTYYPEINLRNI